MIRPAVAGVESVLAAVAKAGAVRRVVMTSSVAAVVGDHWERGRHHVFTEADWNLTATEAHLPYHRCWRKNFGDACRTALLLPEGQCLRKELWKEAEI